MLFALAYINLVIIHQFLLVSGPPIKCREVGRLAQTTGHPIDAGILVAQHSTIESFNPKRSSSLPQDINEHCFSSSSYWNPTENIAAIDVHRRDVESSLALITNNTCVIDNETLKVRCNLDNLLNNDEQWLHYVNERYPLLDTSHPIDADILVAQHSTIESFSPKRSLSLPQDINEHCFSSSSYWNPTENIAAIDVHRRDVESSLALITNNTCVIDNETLKVRCNLDNLLNNDKQWLDSVNERYPSIDTSQYAKSDNFTSMDSKDSYRSISSFLSPSSLQTTTLTSMVPPIHYSLPKNKTLEVAKSKLLHIPELHCCCRKLENNLFYCVHAENGCEGLQIDDQNPLLNNKKNQGRFKIDETLLKTILNKSKFLTSTTALTKKFDTTPISLVDFLKPLPSQSNQQVSKKYDAIVKVQCDIVKTKLEATAHTHDILNDFLSSTMSYVENLLNMKMALVGARPFTPDLPPRMKFELEDTDRRMESSLKRKDVKDEQRDASPKGNTAAHNSSKQAT